jgi:hypothetical protein
MARERKGSIVKRDGKIYGRVQFIDEMERSEICGERQIIKNTLEIL